MAKPWCHPCILTCCIIGLSALTALTAGCGAIPGDPFAPQALFLNVSDCPAGNANAESTDVVVLDWTGGGNQIYRDENFEGVDLSVFETAEGGTLADDEETFKERVRAQVARIYCDCPDANLIVINGEDDEPADTIVHVTQNTQPDDGKDIGEAEYDPCNLQDDNAAIIFGERLWQLSDTYTFDEWVYVFANVTAHEIGHTLGYAHVARANQPEIGRMLITDLMLDRHTMAEMRRPQAFLTELSYCPSDPSQKSRSVNAASASEDTYTVD
ncbi:MAG: hypothetical protein JSU63_02165 [Phycisphaerales bacterium]|nr:MAG: hypothetical protein JSU63_02165 [Phycisphaerales bacterium]